MGKKRTVATPLFPFPTSANQAEPQHHFSHYGFDPQLLCFSQQTEAKRAAARRHQQPLEPARFKLQKSISKTHQHRQQQSKPKQRRRWWSSAASAALLFFKRPPSDPTARAASAASSSSYSTGAGVGCAATAFGASRLLYLADDDDATGCTCWASPPMRAGHMAAAEVGVASAMFPYVSLRDLNVDCGAGGVTPSMIPIYLVT